MLWCLSQAGAAPISLSSRQRVKWVASQPRAEVALPDASSASSHSQRSTGGSSGVSSAFQASRGTFWMPLTTLTFTRSTPCSDFFLLNVEGVEPLLQRPRLALELLQLGAQGAHLLGVPILRAQGPER